MNRLDKKRELNRLLKEKKRRIDLANSIQYEYPEKLEKFKTTKKRFKIAYGGRGGAKSHTFADMLIEKSVKESAKIGCLREYQNSIDDSVYSLINAEIPNIGAEGFTVFKSYMDNSRGGGFRFKGLARSIESVKSAYGFKYFWLEEGQFISKTSLKTLTPTLREDDSELWISANPMNSSDPFSQRFIVPFQSILDKDGIYEDELHLIVKINYDGNPWFPASLELERQYDFNTLPRALYDHIWLGAFNDSVENSIILAEWFDAAIDAHIKLGFKPLGIKVVAHDPSDLGPDDKSLVVRHGSVVTEALTKTDGDVNDGMDWAIDHALEINADLFTWDGHGMGASLAKQAKDAFDGKHTDYQMYKSGDGTKNPHEIYGGGEKNNKKAKTNEETFYNRRSQDGWGLRDKFLNTYQAVTKGVYKNPEEMISISSKIKDIAKLRTETCRIPRKHNGNGMIQIMPKPEMKRLYKIPSPNLYDGLVMSQETINKGMGNFEDMEFDSLW